MGVTILVPFETITAAAASWDTTADKLDGAWRRLGSVSTRGFSPAVAAAVETFRETWVEELKRQATAAQDHCESLGQVALSAEAVDLEQARHLRDLLPWACQDAVLREGS